MVTKDILLEYVAQIFEDCPGNTISAKDAICPEIVGLDLFEAPLVGIGAANDPLFQLFKENTIIGPWYMTPSEWLPNAKTIISLFFPFTETVKESNHYCTNGPSTAWLHGPYEGQNYLKVYMAALGGKLADHGISYCIPTIDSRFRRVAAGNNMTEYTCVNEHTFGSNWSERHCAYVCGLGTFGLSKGLITQKGMAGRFASIIIDAEIQPDTKAYSGIYDYCIKCGACIRRCPVDAITMESGKNHNICNDWLNKIKAQNYPRYGCGLCQTKVPCESKIPHAEKQ